MSALTELPTTFGKYFLTDKLATGGMAEIFLGKLIGPGGFEKQLVIKQIHPALSGQHHFVDLFVAEAKTLVTLAHGNIVPVYELGVVDDTYFIAMEYIDGPTLWRLTESVISRAGAIAAPIAAWIAGEIAKGLDYAHRKGAGVIHRDLSPRNVMLARDGEVKLVDFGIAVGLGGGEERDDGGMPTGSFPYMSPEQVARRPLTGQSDLFSLGVLLWEMLAGARLFARATPEATLAAVEHDDIPPPSARRGDVPERLDMIALRALERDPDKRWRDAGEMLAALQRYLYALEPPPSPRDVAALVARHCPPLVRPATGDPAPGSAPGDGPATDVGGPSTQVMAGSRPRGKRKPTVREATFATNVALDVVLGRATPLVPLSAITDDDLAPTRADPPATAKRKAAIEPAPAPATGPASAPAIDKPSPPDHKVARRWPMLLLAATALAAIAVLAWMALRPPRRVLVTADGALSITSIDAASSAPNDAGAIDASTTDASIAIDGPASPTARIDAHGPAIPAAIDAALAATGRLTVGANPWGEVYLDGHRLGRAPDAWDVPAGAHHVEVVFPDGEDGEVRRRYEVTVPAAGAKTLYADFTAP